LSPPLVGFLAYGLGLSELRKRYQFWYVYLGLSLLFYLVLFDFSKLTLERYMMFLIIPACIIGGGILVEWLKGLQFRKNFLIVVGLFIMLVILVLVIPQDVLPLNPKGAYIEHVEQLDFNFLIPLTGGSGPIGFYFSTLFILVSFVITVISSLAIYYRFVWHKAAVILLVTFGVGYNILFVQEYLFGRLFGSVPAIARAAVEYVNKTPAVKEVITYNDIDAYYLRLSGKYSGRFYTAPSRDYTVRLTGHRGHYLIVDFPAIGKKSQYWQLISRCPVEKEFTDDYVKGYIFDCTELK
jgi:hypothetical protein